MNKSVTVQNGQKKFFLLNLTIFYIGGNKKRQKQFFFSEMQKFGSEDQ